jgi:MFS family permease
MKFFRLQTNVYFAFFIYAFSLGVLFSRIGDLQLQMGIEESALGFALIGLSTGVQLSLFFADKILKLIGFRTAMCLGLPLIGLSQILASYAAGAIDFFCALVIGGLAVGIVEVAVNLEADRVEYQLQLRIMNRSHAFWSLGFFASGLLGALISQMQVTPTTHFSVLFILITLFSSTFIFGYQPASPRPNINTQGPKFIIPTKEIMVLVIFTISAMAIEGAGIDWSVIFMRDIFTTPPLINGAALALGAFSQFIVRFFADQYLDQYGAETVSRLSILSMFAGVCLLCFASLPAMALVGFSLMGAGNAVLFPLAMSAAAQREDRPAAVNVASLAQISFLAFLLAPPLLGFIAERYGIRFSFSAVLPLLLASWFTVHSVAARQSHRV